MNPKIRVARISVISNSFLITIKLAIGLLSGSVSILSEAIHSSMDLIASVIAFFSVKVSDNPPDSRHPYGHGKVENISGVIEALLIFIAAIWIIIEAIKKLTGGHAIVESLGLGSLVMVISAIVNTLVSRQLYKVARQTGSVALEADALHLKTDVYTSLGVAVGLGLILLTGVYWLDPVVAICVAGLIIKESWELTRKAFRPLLDEAWSDDEVEKLEKMLNAMEVNYHGLRTRVSGNYRFVDFHVEIPKDQSVENAHTYCDRIEEILSSKFDKLNITIHVEPS
jgi:cation diffusion facilitator family transporter